VLRTLAGRARNLACRLANPIDRIVHPDAGGLLPPGHLRVYYYRTWDPARFTRACEGAKTELMLQGLKPEHRVLDIGSGIGNLAIGLLDFLHGGFDGIEIHEEAVAWCQHAITPRHPTFRFHRADLSSGAYNPGGHASPDTYRFPFPDRSFDFIFLSSVFTHMLPATVEHYVREISRMLAPGGVCVASYFLLTDETRVAVNEGRSFMSFSVAHPSGLCRLHDAAVPEAAVALEEAFIERIHEQAGLRVKNIRRGRWWAGAAHDQDVLAVIAPPAAAPNTEARTA
jgi:SAM-dependent methyltransferase